MSGIYDSIPPFYGAIKARISLPTFTDYTVNLPRTSVAPVSLNRVAPIPRPSAPTLVSAPFPTFTAILETAQTAAYSAVSQTLDFVDPPFPVQPVYADAMPVPNAHQLPVPPAPLNYPLFGRITEPRRPDLSYFTVPEISISSAPALISILVRGFEQTIIPLFSEFLADPGTLHEPIDLPDIQPFELTKHVDFDAALRDVLNKAKYDSIVIGNLRDRLYEQEDLLITLEERASYRNITYSAASRGFSGLSGIERLKVHAVAEKAALARLSAAEKVSNELYKLARANVDAGLSMQSTLESTYFAAYKQYRDFVVARHKYIIAKHKTLLDTAVEFISLKTRVLDAQLQAYNTYIKAIIEQYSGYSAYLSQINAKMQTYKAEVAAHAVIANTIELIANVNSLAVEDAVLRVKEYESYIQGILYNVEVLKNNVAAYQTAIGAYAKLRDTDLAYLDAYNSYVTTSAANAELMQANAQNYLQFVETEQARVSAYEQWIGAATSVLNAEVSNYRQYLQAHKSYVNTVANRLEANIRIMNAYMSGVSAVHSYVSEYNRTYAAWHTYDLHVSMYNVETHLAQEMLRLSAETDTADIEANLRKAEALILAGWAQAMYSTMGMSVSVTANANAGISARMTRSFSDSNSFSCSLTNDTTKSLSV